MTTYVIKQASGFDDVTVGDLLPFVDARGHLDVRIEGGAVARPFAVLNVLRAAGFLHTHTWVESGPDARVQGPVTLRVTAELPRYSVEQQYRAGGSTVVDLHELRAARIGG